MRPGLSTVVAPAIVAAALVLEAWSGTAAPWTAALRPLGVAVAFGVAVALILLALTRRPAVASLVGVSLTAAVMRPGSLLLPVIGCVCVVLAMRLWRRMRARPMVGLTTAHVTVPALAFMAIVLVGSVTGGALHVQELLPEARPASVAAGAERRPNIYVLLLDGYPRADVLQEAFGYDNGRFIASLEELGFTVADEVTTRFRRSELTLASTMLSDPSAVDAHAAPLLTSRETIESRRAVRREFLGNLPTMDAMRAAGYELVYIASPIEHTDWRGWDLRIDTNQLTLLETSLLQRSLLATVVDDWIVDQHRDRVTESLAAWAGQAGRARQQVVFGHIMSPHPPFLFGERTDPLPCWYETTCTLFQVRLVDLDLPMAEYGRRFTGQLEVVNELFLEAVNSVVAHDPGAIVVVMSDHGARYLAGTNEEDFQSFFAARLPDGWALDGTPGPDALFVRLLDLVTE